LQIIKFMPLKFVSLIKSVTNDSVKKKDRKSSRCEEKIFSFLFLSIDCVLLCKVSQFLRMIHKHEMTQQKNARK